MYLMQVLSGMPWQQNDRAHDEKTSTRINEPSFLFKSESLTVSEVQNISM